MSAVVELVATLRARGVALEARGDRVRLVPADRVQPAELAALRARKAEVLALLKCEAATDDSWADGVPDGPCGLCGHHPLAEVRGWPMPGAAGWLCLACAGGPVPSFEAVYASLSVDERGRLLDEARAGDPLARLLLTLVPMSGVA
jgi:hypothetical protein